MSCLYASLGTLCVAFLHGLHLCTTAPWITLLASVSVMAPYGFLYWLTCAYNTGVLKFVPAGLMYFSVLLPIFLRLGKLAASLLQFWQGFLFAQPLDYKALKIRVEMVFEVLFNS